MNKTIIITGFRGSIGSFLKEFFSSLGYKVVDWDIRKCVALPVKKFDAIIFCHGGYGNGFLDSFIKNISFFSIEIPKLKKVILKNNAQLIVFTSRRAIRPTEQSWDYAASKAAVHTYCRALYKDNPSLKITAISPGWVESKIAKCYNVKSVIPLKEIGYLLKCLLENHNMRIPEIFIEPIGDSNW